MSHLPERDAEFIGVSDESIDALTEYRQQCIRMLAEANAFVVAVLDDEGKLSWSVGAVSTAEDVGAILAFTIKRASHDLEAVIAEMKQEQE